MAAPHRLHHTSVRLTALLVIAAATALGLLWPTPRTAAQQSLQSTFAVDGNANTFLEAEAYSSAAGPWRVVADASRSGGAYVDTPNQGGGNSANVLRYELNVVNGGAFYLSLLSTGPDGSSDSFFVSIDGGPLQQVVAGPNGQWLWKKPSGTLALADGRHTLVVHEREDGARLDQLFLSKSSAAPATPTAVAATTTQTATSTQTATTTRTTTNTATSTSTSTATTSPSQTATATSTPSQTPAGGAQAFAIDGAIGNYLEAEAYSSAAGPWRVVADASRSGGAYVDTPNQGGGNSTNVLRYDLNVVNGGAFYLSLLSTGPDGSSDSFFVSVDGGPLQQVVTGANGQWLWKKPSGTLALADGRHTLVVHEREDGARLDQLFLSKSSAAPATATPAATTPTQTVSPTRTPTPTEGAGT